jgi:hypothetical protein
MDKKTCEAKRSQYNFIIDSFNHKNNSILELSEVIKFIKRNDIELFENHSESVDQSCFEVPNSLIIILYCKWKPIDLAISLCKKVRDKFGCDTTLTMTDDDECNEYRFFKGSDYGKIKK